MKRIIPVALLAMIATMTVVTPANAQSFGQPSYRTGWGGGASVNATQAQLQARINQGVSSGRLNQRESAKLQAKLNRIGSMEAQMRASGNRLSMRERARLTSQLSQLSNQITKELNDFERRRVGYWNRGRWTR